MRRVVLLGWAALAATFAADGGAACGGAAPAESAPAPAAPVAAAAADRSGPTAGVPGLELPDAKRHAEVRRGLRARLDFVRHGEERPDLLQRIALDHLEEAGEAEQAALRVADRMAEVGAYPEGEALRARLDADAAAGRAEAIGILEGVVKDFPTHERAAAALFSLASALQVAGRGADAVPLLRRLVAEHSGSEFVPDALLDLGDAAFDRGDMVAAQRQYEAVRGYEDAPVRPYATYKLAWVFWNLREAGKALAALREVATLPDAAAGTPQASLRREALHDYARFYAEVGRPEAAPADFRALAPDQAPALLARLGQAYGETGRFQDARAVWAALLAETAACAPARLTFHQERLHAALLLGDRAAAATDAEAWGAELDRVSGCAPFAERGEVSRLRQEGLTALRELVRQWRLERRAGAPEVLQAIARVEAVLEGLDPEDPAPDARVEP